MNTNQTIIRFNVSAAQRGVLLMCITLICYLISSAISWILMRKGITAPRVYIATVIQDVIVFILPSLLTAMLITRQPADFLQLREPRGGVRAIMVAVAALLMSVPVMNVIVDWNANIQLPDSMGAFAEWMKSMEASAAETISTMIDGASVVNYIVLLLVVGLFAGLSEELFFRGAIQRLMITARVNPHLAIWVTAFIFSAIHFQFFGFVPRMLLGAMFGYMAWWTGSVWTSVAAHVTNNVLAATVMWSAARDASGSGVDIDALGRGNIGVCFASLLLTGFMLYGLYRYKKVAPGS